MDIFYPPYIEGKIPAQYGDTLRIPFEHSRALDPTDKTMSAKIKTVFNEEEQFTLSGTFENGIATFPLGTNSLEVTDFYKIQLAYVDEKNTGTYSTVGVFKYTGTPTIYIKNLNSQQSNPIGNYFEGKYENTDTSELEYSYKFTLFNEAGVVIFTTGEQIHKAQKDDVLELPFGLSAGRHYKLSYSVTTINGLNPEISYDIYYNAFQDNQEEFGCELIATPNNDKGFIELLIHFTGNKSLYGQYRLLRYVGLVGEVLDNFKANTNTDFVLYQDNSVEHGVIYRYAIQRYTTDAQSTKLYSDEVFCGFDDMFLSDGEKSLCIKFDPKISSFKVTMPEQKVDAMGSQYPIFFRHGATKYKEFPIAGLISVLMTDNEEGVGTNLVHETFVAERNFKMSVMNWLMNGQPKMFRSPAEGNFVVRLMNISLSPKDQLGRMLHSFTSNAYEVMDYSFSNLLKYNLVKNIQDFGMQPLSPEKDKEYNFSNLTYLEIKGPTTLELQYKGSSLQRFEVLDTFIVPQPEKLEIIKYVDGNQPIFYLLPFQEEFIGNAFESQGTVAQRVAQYEGEEVDLTDKNVLYLALSAKRYNGEKEEDYYKAKIVTTEHEFELDLTPQIFDVSNNTNVYEIETHPGDTVFTNKDFIDGIFNPVITLGQGVIATVYYEEKVKNESND